MQMKTSIYKLFSPMGAYHVQIILCSLGSSSFADRVRA